MTITASRPVTVQPTSRAVVIAAGAVPVLVAGQFALLAGIPVAVVLVGTLRDPRLRPLRWWTAALTAAYAIPVATWLIGPSDAPSLSKYLNPAATAAIAGVGLVVAVAHHLARRRSGGSSA